MIKRAEEEKTKMQDIVTQLLAEKMGKTGVHDSHLNLADVTRLPPEVQ